MFGVVVKDILGPNANINCFLCHRVPQVKR
jgi:hypothetical protein